MRKFLLLAVTFIAMSIVTSCLGAPAAQERQDGADFSYVLGREWKLTGVFVNGQNTGFSRNALAVQGFIDAFTISFDAERLSGAGAPNRYFAAYTLGENRAINVSMVASTMMAAIIEPEELREHDYFFFIEHATEWNLIDGNLELLSRSRAGEEVKLIFRR